MVIEDKIKEWVTEALQGGYNPEEIYNILIRRGFDSKEIKEVLSVCTALNDLNALGFKEKEITEGNILQTKIVKSKEIQEVSKLINATKKEIAKAVMGQDEIVNACICAILCDGHVLLEGVPGIAKTLLVKSLAVASGCSAKRIQFTVDLLPSDIVGVTTFTQNKGFETIKGPIFANFIIADEINRSPPKTQSALIEAMQERQVTIGRTTFALPAPFFVMANQNPIETEGVYSLPEAQVDRFLFKIIMDYPDIESEEKIMSENTTLKRFEDYNVR